MEATMYNGYKINIYQEEYSESPREWDNLGKMVCNHRQYTLGDEQVNHNYANSWSEQIAYYFADNYGWQIGVEYSYNMTETQFTKVNKWIEKNICLLPLYLYDHSGITMNTTGFGCGWDSGQVGFIFIDKATVLKEFGGKILTKKLKEKALDYLKNEVKTYDQYLTGDVYEYRIYDENEDGSIDSCGGFYEEAEALKEAKSICDFYASQRIQNEVISEAKVSFANEYFRMGGQWAIS